MTPSAYMVLTRPFDVRAFQLAVRTDKVRLMDIGFSLQKSQHKAALRRITFFVPVRPIATYIPLQAMWSLAVRSLALTDRLN